MGEVNPIAAEAQPWHSYTVVLRERADLFQFVPDEGIRVVDVAVVNTSEELADLLEEVMRSEGWSTARGYTLDFKRGRKDVRAFFREHDPRVIVWDIAIPYDENWNLCQEIQRLPEAEERQFILTTTNIDVLQRLIGQEIPARELIGKPFDLEELCTAVRQALDRS